MSKILGGFGMNKGVSNEDVMNEIVVRTNGVVEANRKGNEYVINEIIEHVRSNPNVMVNMILPATREIVKEELRSELIERDRNMQTWFMEMFTQLGSNNKNEQQNVIEWLDYGNLARQYNCNGTDFKYLLCVLGYLIQRNKGGNFYVVEEAFEKDLHGISLFTKIDKSESYGTPNKDEYYFNKDKAHDFMVNNIENIRNAKNTYNAMKLKNATIDKFVEEVSDNIDDRAMIDELDSSNLADTNMLEKDIKRIVNDVLNGDVSLRNECYKDLRDSLKWNTQDYWNEFNAYKIKFKRKYPLFTHEASQIRFIVFEKGYAKNLLSVVWDKNPVLAQKVFDEYQKEKQNEKDIVKLFG